MDPLTGAGSAPGVTGGPTPGAGPEPFAYRSKGKATYACLTNIMYVRNESRDGRTHTFKSLLMHTTRTCIHTWMHIYIHTNDMNISK